MLVDSPAGRRWTYGELGVAIDALACGLAAKGIGKADRVGIWAELRGMFLVQYATAKIGAILVNINPVSDPRVIGQAHVAFGKRPLISRATSVTHRVRPRSQPVTAPPARSGMFAVPTTGKRGAEAEER